MAPDKAIETPRSALAITIGAVVLSVGATLMPDAARPYLIFSFYVMALLTLWLCQTEINAVWLKISKHQPDAITIPADFWIVMIAVAVELVVPTYFVFANPNEENLQVSPQIEALPANALRVNYTFRNFGKQSALVRSLALLEIVALSQREDPNEFCDEIKAIDLVIIETVPSMMGTGAQVGDAALRRSLYYPKEVMIDGVRTGMTTPIEIESTKTKTLTAIFGLNPDHAKDADTLVICPLIFPPLILKIESMLRCVGARSLTYLWILLSIDAYHMHINSSKSFLALKARLAQ
jgi:hypothetical protein